MVLSDPIGVHSHQQGDGVSLLISHDWQRCDTHRLDGVLLCSVSMHQPGLDIGYESWTHKVR